MAKKSSGGVNKSQAIRDAIAANPKAQSMEIVKLLAGKGIKVDPHLVYFVRSHDNRKKKKQKRLQVAETSRSTGPMNPVEMVLSVKRLAMDAGGLKNLKKLVDALAE